MKKNIFVYGLVILVLAVFAVLAYLVYGIKHSRNMIIENDTKRTADLVEFSDKINPLVTGNLEGLEMGKFYDLSELSSKLTGFDGNYPVDPLADSNNFVTAPLTKLPWDKISNDIKEVQKEHVKSYKIMFIDKLSFAMMQNPGPAQKGYILAGEVTRYPGKQDNYFLFYAKNYEELQKSISGIQYSDFNKFKELKVGAPSVISMQKEGYKAFFLVLK